MKSNTERISSTANIDLTLDTSGGTLEAVVVVESEVEVVVVVVVLEESGVQSS